MPRRQGYALLIALVAGTAALAAAVAFAGSLLFSGSGARPQQIAVPDPRSVARTPAAAAHSTGLWAATWTAAPVTGVVDSYNSSALNRRTIRDVVHTSIGGDAARITLSNAFGTRPLVMDRVTVSARPVTFAGARTVTVAAGGQVVSDPVTVPVAADSDLVVTLRTPTARGPVTVHERSHQTSYVDTAWGTRRTDGWRYLTAVDVHTRTAAGTIAVIGDSLTAGTGSSLDTNSRWPDVLADRLGGRYGVANAGIAGNRILRDGHGGRGVRASARFEHDVLDVAGVKTVVVALGINDVQQSPQETDPQRIADGLRAMTRSAHAQGLRVVGATLMPYEGFATWTPGSDDVRVRVNALIRSGGVFDSVIDFDAAARDPHRPTRLLPAYDSGDHLHLNDAGYRQLGSMVDLTTLVPDRATSDQL
ncbi:SGNH/GDSL hydrolase family protein [Streptomyces sp. NBC_01005]|uniref:SGNH/GDSL hydrolase family protein n=1 Tax=unclassified Streptomyces TaxID=2593676 RepID=UPI0038644D88|nr:SGNH/GDSL hydrolase family protein [Streptomyces sp. NBC_01005]WTC97136.1 SGNH/GDSL hydrolase family protein [Streptomyces sp. NBC_01650]